MNSNDREHPADLKASEVLFTISTNFSKTTNNRNDTSPTTSSGASSRKSSINLDICCELDQRKIRDHSEQEVFVKLPQTCPQYNENDSLHRATIFSTSVDMKSLECEKELQFIRAVIWMKSAVQMMKEVTENDIKQAFGVLLSKNISLNNDVVSSQRSQRVNMPPSQELTTSKFYQNQKGSCNISNNCAGQKMRYLIPDVEEPASPTSPIVSFCESSSQDTSNNKLLHSIGDSGIVLLDSFNRTSKFERSQLISGKENNPPQLSKAVHAVKDIGDGHVRKKLKRSELTLSPTSLSSLIEQLRLNNFVLGEVRIILRLLEKDETAQNYMKSGLIIRDAVDTIVQFLNQLDTADDMSSSIIYMNLCTENIMATVKKVFRSRTYGHLNGVARYNQLITLLGFCGCRKICEKIIDLLVNSLTKLMEMIEVNSNEYENQPMMRNDTESYLLCHILQMAVKKYCDIVGPSLNINENGHHYVTHLWRKLWKNHKEYEPWKFRSKELESDWINKLQKLINLQFPMAFSIFGDCKAILKAIKMLSTPPLNRT